MMKHAARLIMAGAMALATVAMPVGAAAQVVAHGSTGHEDSGTYPLAGLNDAEIAEFFATVSASEQMGEWIEPLIAELLVPGPAVAGWQNTGVDLLAEIGERPGGLSGNLLHDPDQEVPTATDLSGTATPDLPGFHTLAVRPAAPGDTERTFASFWPGIWLALDFPRTTQGNALCYGGTIGVTIHSRTPIDRLDQNAVFAAAALAATFDRLTERAYCVVYSRDAGGYTSLAYLPDGRRLPELDSASPLQIMKSEDLAAFIRDTVAAPLEE